MAAKILRDVEWLIPRYREKLQNPAISRLMKSWIRRLFQALEFQRKSRERIWIIDSAYKLLTTRHPRDMIYLDQISHMIARWVFTARRFWRSIYNRVKL